MAFQLKLSESVCDGIRRVSQKEITKALEQLRSHGQEGEAIHEVRKGLKKVRAALRLVRDELGDTVYHRENFALRDAARPLTEVRDAEMLVETLPLLAAADAGQPHAFDEVREAFLRNQQVVTERVLKNGRTFAGVAVALERTLAGIPDWTIDHDGWPALGNNLKRVYREGRRALALATTEPTVENLHEWRKQTKYLWHQFQLVEPAWINGDAGLADRAHALTRILGEDHDLAVLRQVVTADPSGHGGQRLLKGLVTVVDRRRLALAEEAFALGQQVHGDAPKVFTERIAGGWRAWRSEVDEASGPGQPPTPASGGR